MHKYYCKQNVEAMQCEIQAIDRILEATGLANYHVDEEKRQVEIYKRIRKE